MFIIKIMTMKIFHPFMAMRERNFKIAFNDFPCSGSAGHFGPELETHTEAEELVNEIVALMVCCWLLSRLFMKQFFHPLRSFPAEDSHTFTHTLTHARSQFHGKAAIIDYLFLGSSALPTSWRYLNFPSRDDCEEIVYQISTLICVYIIWRRKSLVLRLLFFSFFLFWEWKII